MTKFKMNGKAMLTVLSVFAFMILGSVSASAQWVTPNEAVILLKGELTTLENDFNQATTDQERFDIVFEMTYYKTVMLRVSDGEEVPTAVEAARPTEKPVAHSSGLVYFTADDPNFKLLAQAFVDAGTDLLSN